MNHPQPSTPPNGTPILPNALSLLRIGLTPVILFCLHRDGGLASGTTIALLLIAIATDALDGLAARALGQVSRLGKILDPLADKLLVGAVGVALVLWYGFPIWLIALQVARDVAILGAGVFLWRSRHVVEPTSRLGKAATTAMGGTMLGFAFGVPAPAKAVLIYTTAVTLVWSSLDYIRILARIIRNSSRA